MGGPLSAFTGDYTLDSKVANLLIAPLDDNGKIDESLGGAKILQYFPDSIEDSRSANWQPREIMGSPLPLYQWVSGSERIISFTARFTRDMTGQIGVDTDEDKYNVDIDAAIAWLHMLSWNDYVEVGDSGPVATAPPILWLHAQGKDDTTGTQLGYNLIATENLGQKNTQGVYCVLTEVGVTRENWFQDGNTRMATVSLSFAEVMQVGQGVFPYGRSAFLSLTEKYTRKP